MIIHDYNPIKGFILKNYRGCRVRKWSPNWRNHPQLAD